MKRTQPVIKLEDSMVEFKETPKSNPPSKRVKRNQQDDSVAEAKENPESNAQNPPVIMNKTWVRAFGHETCTQNFGHNHCASKMVRKDRSGVEYEKLILHQPPCIWTPSVFRFLNEAPYFRYDFSYVPPPIWAERLNLELAELRNQEGLQVNVIEPHYEWQVEFLAPPESNWNCGGKRFILKVEFWNPSPDKPLSFNESFDMPKLSFKESPLTKEQNIDILCRYIWSPNDTVTIICKSILALLLLRKPSEHVEAQPEHVEAQPDVH